MLVRSLRKFPRTAVTFCYWVNTYWGGAVAALGGALVLGALPRIKRHQRVRDSLFMGLGFAILANSRPYEGLFLSIPVIVAILIWARRNLAPFPRILLVRTALPLTLLSIAIVLVMGYYFWRTTGNPFQTPYAVDSATYRPVPLFPWQTATTVLTYRHPVMEKLYRGWITQQYDFARSHPLVLILAKFWATWAFFIGPLFTLPLLAVCFVLPYGVSFRDFSKRTRLLMLTSGSFFLGAALPVCYNAHYLAPVTCLLYALLLIAMGNVRRWKPWGRPSGVAIVRFTILIAVLLLARAVVSVASVPISPSTWVSPIVWTSYRADILSQLSKMPGSHLVIVRYDTDHDPMDEWVYNDAEIDTSKVVWAREMSPEHNFELMRYFKGRKVWLVEPDQYPVQLVPYRVPCGNAKPATASREK